MAALGELVVSLSANTAKFTEGMNKAEYQSQKAFDNMKKSAVAYGAAIGTVAVAAVTAFAFSVKKAVDAADEMSKASQKVGVTTEALSQLKYAADLSGVSFEGLQNGLKKLSVNLYEASNGTITQVETFKALGLSVKDSSGKLKSADMVLEEIADTFQRMPDGVKKTALAVEAFGKAGADLIPMLNGGADGIRTLRDEADMLGLTIDKAMAIDAEKFNDSIAKLSASYDGFAMRTGSILLPALNAIVDTVDDTIFGFDKLERAIRKQRGTDVGSWKPTPMIGDKPKEGEFNLSLGEYAVVAEKKVEIDKDAARLAEQAAKALSDARKKAAEEANASEVRRLNIAIWVNEQIYKANKEKLDAIDEDRRLSIEMAAEKQKEFNAEVERVKDALDPTREYTTQIQTLAAMFDAGRLTADEFSEAAANAQQQMLGFTESGINQFDELKNAIDGFAQDGANAMADFIFGTEKSFGEMVNSMLKDLARLALQRSIFDPLVKGLGASFNEGGGGILGFLGNMVYGGGRAQGGNVQGGKSYLVGEYGPEVVTMGGNGTVTPNMGGNVSVSVNVDATGGSVESNESFGKQLGSAIKATVQAELLKQKRQGGLLA